MEALKILTPREIEILDFIEKGYTDAEIAAALFLSVRTVHSHKRRMHEKIGLAGKNAIPKWLWGAKNGESSLVRRISK